MHAASLFPDARVEVFEDSADVAFREETDRYLAVTDAFLVC